MSQSTLVKLVDAVFPTEFLEHWFGVSPPTKFHWSNPSSYILYGSKIDLVYSAVIAVVLTFLRIWIQNMVLEGGKPFFEALIVDPEKRAATLRKYSESAWKFIIYSFLAIFAACLILPTDWLVSDCLQVTVDELHDPNLRQVTEVQKMYWRTILGFYIHSIYAHFYLEVKRNDFWPMLIHHFICIIMIGNAYLLGMSRLGIIVHCLHDISDIILELGKMHVYRQEEFFSNCLFGTWVLSWIVLRLWIYPVHVIGLSISKIHQIPTLGGMVCVYCILYFLHVYWFTLILKMIYKMFVGGQSLEDNRED